MFSYRHTYHAGNHADVLKHITLTATLDYLLQAKETPLLLVDTHAGNGLYRLDGDDARTSGEAQAGILPLWAHWQQHPPTAPALRAYQRALASLNPEGTLRTYPGSPWLAATLARPQDSLRLFELHPTDSRLLHKHMAAHPKTSQIQVVRNNGFTGLKTLLPPSSRRALVLIDPSYELKTDYTQTAACVQDALGRFATGCYMVWYPVIARPEAHTLPRRLRSLATQAGKPWLHATLSIGKPAPHPTAPPTRQARNTTAHRTTPNSGLRASAVFVINPPFVLHTQLRDALTGIFPHLRQGHGAAWTLDGSDKQARAYTKAHHRAAGA